MRKWAPVPRAHAHLCSVRPCQHLRQRQRQGPRHCASVRASLLSSVGASFGIAIAYRACDELFVQVGNLNQLPAAVAAWSPDAIFLLAGLYMMTRMRS